MPTAVLVLSGVLSVASFIAFVMIVIAAVEDEVWKGILGFFFWPYLLYWALVEYYDEGKWPRVITWIGGSVLSIVLFATYFYLLIPKK